MDLNHIGSEPPVYVMGDVHGQLAKLQRVLHHTGLMGEDGSWVGGRAELWLLGDYVDRGPGSPAVLDLIMQLQIGAEAAGGRVHALLGNHDVQLLAATRFPDARSTGPGGTFRSDWLKNGGDAADLDCFTDGHLQWLQQLPAMLLGHHRLFAHADSEMYEAYGGDVDEVNQAFQILLRSDDTGAWDRLLHRFSEREAFYTTGAAGEERAQAFLDKFGGKQFIHGHTPIDKLTRQKPEDVLSALAYAGDLCVDVDGGMYRGGPGFAYEIVPREAVIL